MHINRNPLVKLLTCCTWSLLKQYCTFQSKSFSLSGTSANNIDACSLFFYCHSSQKPEPCGTKLKASGYWALTSCCCIFEFQVGFTQGDVMQYYDTDWISRNSREYFLSSTAPNSYKYFVNFCEKGSYTGFCEQTLSFRKSHNERVLFYSLIKLTRCLSTPTSFWLKPALLCQWWSSRCLWEQKVQCQIWSTGQKILYAWYVLSILGWFFYAI